jgi:hypothetical protein
VSLSNDPEPIEAPTSFRDLRPKCHRDPVNDSEPVEGARHLPSCRPTPDVDDAIAMFPGEPRGFCFLAIQQ